MMHLEVEHLAAEQMCTPAPEMLLVVTLIGFLIKKRPEEGDKQDCSTCEKSKTKS